MLIPCDRLDAADLAAWRRLEAVDAVNARRMPLERMALAAMDAIEAFVAVGGVYSGVSWGKDSVVVTHLVARLRAERGLVVPVAYIRVVPVDNPYCLDVRDAFLARNVVDYNEITIECPRVDGGGFAGSRVGAERDAAGYAECVRRFGGRYISGVRAEESRVRKLRAWHWGVSSPNTCAPLSWWTADHVFAYLHKHDLPVHPSYAMSMGGRWDRRWLRVSTIAHGRGDERGLAEWERRYYPAERRRITQGA